MILGFAKWKKIYEQAAPTADKIEFVIMAGASKVPMSDETLAKNQGYPADTAPTTTIYELSLADAIAKNFSKAVAVGQASNTEKDQIIFENTSIKNAGQIAIEWNPANAAKKIRVSGNGALVLARVANQFNERLKVKKGVIRLELSANALYSKLWSIDQMGMSVSALMTGAKGIIAQAAVQTSEPNLKSKLAEKWGDSVEFVESKYCPAIIEIEANGNQVRNRPDLEKSTALQQYYGKYSADDFIKGKKVAVETLAPIIKTGLIDPGMDALSNYVDSYLKGKLVGLDPNYLARFTDSVKSNVAEAKANMTPFMIKKQLESAITSVPIAAIPAVPTQTTVKSTTYKEGESK